MKAEDTVIEIDLSCLEGYKTTLPRERVVELTQFSSGRIVVMTEQDSYWFESDGISPKGSYLTPMALVKERLLAQAELSFKAGQQNGLSLEMQGEAYCQGVLVGMKEVVELLHYDIRRQIDKDGETVIFRLPAEEWQAQLKEWGLSG